MTTIYFAGGEDSEFGFVGGAAVSTTASSFRSSFARCSLLAGGFGQFSQTRDLRSFPNPFWQTAQVDLDITSAIGNPNSGQIFLGWLDSTLVPRIFLRAAGTSVSGGQVTMQACKQNTAGTITQLGANFQITYNVNSHAVSKLDVFVNYGASGQIQVYQSGLLIFDSGTVDTTTDALSSLPDSFIRCGTVCGSSSFGTLFGWSEIIVSDTDTRALNLQTLAPVANGNTHNFDTGSPAAANVNEITLNDATLDGSTTAGQIDQYTIPAIVSGTWGILAVGISARMAKGASGPSKMDLGVRSSGTDYWSSDQVLATSWSDFQNWWYTDPATAAAWTGLPTNIGLKSVT